jgi:hypothetical protein
MIKPLGDIGSIRVAPEDVDNGGHLTDDSPMNAEIHHGFAA